MLRTLFVFAIIIPGFYLALRSRFIGLLFYLWFALFRPQEFLWLDISSLRLSLVVGLVFVVPTLMSGIWPNLSHPLSKGSWLFLAAAVIAQFTAFNTATGWFWLDFLSRLLIVCLLCISLTNTRERFYTVIAVVAGSFGFHTAKAGVSSLMGGGLRFSEGLAGAFIDNNGYAIGMVMVLWLLVGASQNSANKWLRRGFLAAVPLTAFAAISTFSRGGFIGLVASTLVFVVLQRRRTIAVSVLLVFLLMLPLVPLPEGYTERLRTIQTYDEEQESSALSRLHFWRVAVAMAQDNPLGVGLFNYEFAYDRYDFLDGEFGRRRSVHSSFFQVLAETGFFGALVYFWMIAYSLLVVLRVKRRSKGPSLEPGDARFLETSANALGAAMAGFIGGGAFIALALNDLTWLLFALTASLDRISAAMCVKTPIQAAGIAGLLMSSARPSEPERAVSPAGR